ncbi:MAG: hypothetical protein LAQ69_20945 [Acidobacteriia bacterium]|nr:hypothetical protein [Terriglobia bacterium]
MSQWLHPVRYFLSRRIPEPSSILLVESGSRGLLEGLIPNLRETWSDDIFIDLVTCYAKPPEGFRPENTRIYRVTDYRGREGRGRLYRELAQNRYSMVGIVCSGEPLMTKWKWMLALRIPAKIFIINENGDYFWLDRGHLATLREFVLLRSGLAGAGAVRTLARIVSFPFTFAYLLLYATTVHARRALRRG